MWHAHRTSMAGRRKYKEISNMAAVAQTLIRAVRAYTRNQSKWMCQITHAHTNIVARVPAELMKRTHSTRLESGLEVFRLCVCVGAYGVQHERQAGRQQCHSKWKIEPCIQRNKSGADLERGNEWMLHSDISSPFISAFGDKPLLGPGMNMRWIYSTATILFVRVSVHAGVCVTAWTPPRLFSPARLNNKEILPICEILA